MNDQQRDVDPVRLSEEGGAFDALAQLREKGLSTERLARNRHVLEATLAAHAGGASTAGAGPASFGTGNVALVVLGLGLVVGGAWWLTRDSREDTASQPASIAEVIEAHVPADVVTDPVPLEQAAAIVDAGIDREAEAEPAQADQVNTARPTKEKLTPEPSSSESPETESASDVTPEAPQSDLPAQLALLQQARQKAAAAEHKQALALLAELQTIYPDSPLQAEVDLSRAESLSLSGQTSAAIVLVERLLIDPLHKGRQAQLSQMLGDLWLQSDDCKRAMPAFESALRFGLGKKRSAAARAGIARCQAADTP